MRRLQTDMKYANNETKMINNDMKHSYQLTY